MAENNDNQPATGDLAVSKTDLENQSPKVCDPIIEIAKLQLCLAKFEADIIAELNSVKRELIAAFRDSR